MSTQLLTAQQIREKYNIEQYEKDAQLAYDKNFQKMRQFLKTKNIDTPSLIEDYLGDCIYYLTIENAEKRLEVEQNHRGYIKDRNKRWIKRLKSLRKDPELCDYLRIEIKHINKEIMWLQEDIKWWYIKTIAGENQSLKSSLNPVLYQLKILKYRTTDIITFIYDLFIEFGFDYYGGEDYKDDHRHFIRKVYVEPIFNKLQPPLQGLPLYRIQAQQGGEFGRERLQIARKMERNRREPVTIRIKHKKTFL